LAGRLRSRHGAQQRRLDLGQDIRGESVGKLQVRYLLHPHHESPYRGPFLLRQFVEWIDPVGAVAKI
jgi:hypothetical protein